MTLSVEHLHARYGRIDVVRDVSFEAQRGKVVVVLGPNGAGKTSLLGAIAGVVRSRGSIVVNGQHLDRYVAHRRARMGVSLVPESRKNLFGSLSVRENIGIGVKMLPRYERAKMVSEVLDLFPFLRDRMVHNASVLSGGEQQLLAIAMAQARQPSVLLLDEPSQGLAPVALDRIVDYVDELRRRGVAIVLAEQNYDFALRLADSFIVLNGGSIKIRGETEEMRNRERIAKALIG